MRLEPFCGGPCSAVWPRRDRIRKPGAYATNLTSRKRAAGSGGRATGLAVTATERAAIRRARAYTGALADLVAAEHQARTAVRVAFTMEALPLVARGKAGTFSGISFDEEIGKKPRTKAFTHKTSRAARRGISGPTFSGQWSTMAARCRRVSSRFSKSAARRVT